MSKVSNKKKIINDPIYGFITFPDEFIYDIIQHPYFQRLRRVKQLALTYYVYPGAHHTRFHHAVGAMNLMTKALDIIEKKGTTIDPKDKLGAILAILLHDIGHGPFSHTLEHTIVKGVSHEDLSLLFMEKLNEEFDGRLETCIQIFTNKHPRKFLHQLVSSQLDMDRLDYLKRDSFYTGVSEGVIGSERIIKMLNVKNDELVVEEKGIYSIENFIVARRIMYWQVYLHKTVLSAEILLSKILERARFLVQNGQELFASPYLNYFLKNTITTKDFTKDPKALEVFSKLDDYDVLGAIKVWMDNEDITLSVLSQKLINRELPKVEITNTPITESRFHDLLGNVKLKYGLTDEESAYFVYTDDLVNNAYDLSSGSINILMKDGVVVDLVAASDNFSLSTFSFPVQKYLLSYIP
ncbi:MAG: HD domain-containing protein [Crocinitomicaceae bacterium]|nr:HD domain-containing protein [Crocinitomicaceae bacterium]